MTLEVESGSIFEGGVTAPLEPGKKNVAERERLERHWDAEWNTSSEPIEKNGKPADGEGLQKKPPKVRWIVEYWDENEDTVVHSEDATDNTGLSEHKLEEGPVFEVVDVNYVSQGENAEKPGDGKYRKPHRRLAVRSRGRQFIRIYSTAIINAIQSVVNYYPRISLLGETVDIQEPYAVLVHHKEELEEFREKFNQDLTNEDITECVVDDTYEHLGYLLEFLETKIGDQVRKERARWSQKVPHASFEMLWLLLKPGSDVYFDTDALGSVEPWVISNVDFTPHNGSWTEYTVTLWNLNVVNYYIQPCHRTTHIQHFHGEKAISTLRVFPCQYLDTHSARKAELIERGKMFFYLRRKRCMYFDGKCSTFPQRHFKGHVMVDDDQCWLDVGDNPIADVPIPAVGLAQPLIVPIVSEAVDRKPSGLPICGCVRCSAMESEFNKPTKFAGYSQINPYKVDCLTEHQYFICCCDTWAFVFKIREWRKLYITGFREPQFNTKLIDSLVLKPRIKDMIENLSKTFMEKITPVDDSGRNQKQGKPSMLSWTADFIENKGNGLIFLLHGKPGVGKTYTAECIAEHLCRPLLPITCADIGIEPAEIEANLTKWFKVAKSWGAIMLLDEADIYMEYRQIHDLTRNSLVAGFLRAIEYYEGILFMTTNRVGAFDEAFLSRINVSIYYPDFTDEERDKIWNNYFDKIEREAADQMHVPESTKSYATEANAVRELKWNGREIRNAFQIAVNLAQAEGTTDNKGRVLVKRDHIKATVEMSRDFKEYMVSLHKKTESQRAQILGYRYDSFGDKGTMTKDYY